MCKAFSCIIDQAEKVTWKLGVDSHSELARIGGYADRELGDFAKIEILSFRLKLANNQVDLCNLFVLLDFFRPVAVWCLSGRAA